MTGRNWTELFFLDEATAFAAGHRPCGYCRRKAYGAFVAAWATATGKKPGAKEMDKALHPARVRRDRSQVRFDSPLCALPSGTLVWLNNAPALVLDAQLYPYSPDGYAQPIVINPARIVSVLTPKPTVDVLRAGYKPQIHPTIAANR